MVNHIVNHSITIYSSVNARPGFNNLGNTCFMNATLQCMTYTPVLAQLSLQRCHRSVCKMPNRDQCLFCVLETHIEGALSRSAHSSISPKQMAACLRLISKRFKLGRQEDSHEFLRELMEKLQVASIKSYGVVERKIGRLAQTTLPHQIFGGFFRSQVACTVCDYKSNTYDPLLDVSLVSYL